MNPVRVRMATLMDATVRNRARWHYAQFRPCGAHVTWEEAVDGSVWADCSAGIGIIARLCDAPNPFHAGAIDGIGNTGWCWKHLDHISLHELQVADCVIYGPGPDGTHHMAMCRERGPDPLLWSNGWEGAPEFIRYSTEKARQGDVVTCARLMAADPEPDPLPVGDVWWTWLRWHLGEGEFKGHRRDPKLRPKSAPLPLPPTWWARARKFVAAREAMSP